MSGEHIAMELSCPGWIQSFVDDRDEIESKEAIRAEFERLVEGLELPLSQETVRDSWLNGDCREFRRLSLFVKYHSTYRVKEGGMGLCSKNHWLAAWCILPGHMTEELEIAEQVARDFDRRYPKLGVLALPSEWWQI